jgi:hypothetical protein
MTAVGKPSDPSRDTDATDLVTAQKARTAKAARVAAEARKALADTEASGPMPTIADIVQITLGIQDMPTPTTPTTPGRDSEKTPPPPRGDRR